MDLDSLGSGHRVNSTMAVQTGRDGPRKASQRKKGNHHASGMVVQDAGWYGTHEPHRARTGQSCSPLTVPGGPVERMIVE